MRFFAVTLVVFATILARPGHAGPGIRHERAMSRIEARKGVERGSLSMPGSERYQQYYGSSNPSPAPRVVLPSPSVEREATSQNKAVRVRMNFYSQLTNLCWAANAQMAYEARTGMSISQRELAHKYTDGELKGYAVRTVLEDLNVFGDVHGSISASEIRDELDANRPIVVYLGWLDFKRDGHAVIIYGITSRDTLEIFDPDGGRFVRRSSMDGYKGHERILYFTLK